MLLTLKVLEEIQAARVDLVFRRWRKPTVKTGGRLRTAIGELAIGAVGVVDPAAITDGEARRAGFADGDHLRAELFRQRPATATRGRTAQPTEASVIYRVEVMFAGADSRLALRESLLADDELAGLVARLQRIDERSALGPWTARVLGLIATWPARRAPELAEMEGRETIAFKTDVRKLKELGLTESLRIGYRLSPRGEQVLASVRAIATGREDRASIDALRALCMGLPEVVERLSHGEPTFFIEGKKTFVMTVDDHHGDANIGFWCAAPPGVQAEMVAENPDRFFVPPYVGGRGWLGVRFDDVGVDWTEMAEIVDQAYRCVAPKKLLARLDDTGRRYMVKAQGEEQVREVSSSRMGLGE